MNIRIGNYGIRSDSRNFTVYEVKVITGEGNRGKKAKAENIGKEREVDLGHYYLLNHALKRVLQEELRGEDIWELRQVLNRLDEAMARLDKVDIKHSQIKKEADDDDSK